MILSALLGAMITIGLIIFITLQNTRVPADMRGRIHSFDLFTSTASPRSRSRSPRPAAALLGVQTTLIIAGIAPTVLIAVLFFTHAHPP